MNSVGEKIKQARNSKGMTQKQLAKKLGVAESFINEIENGRKVVNERLIDRLGNILGGDFTNMTTLFDNIIQEENKQEREISRTASKTVSVRNSSVKMEEVNDLWSNALSSVIKAVGIYNYDLNKPIGKRDLPIISNKIEGYAQDKVLYIKIENDDLLGFRICEGDIVFANMTSEMENNKLYLIELNGERVLRQIKKLDSNKVLLISNKNTLRTQTSHPKEIKVIAKLNRVEIDLK